MLEAVLKSLPVGFIDDLYRLVVKSFNTASKEVSFYNKRSTPRQKTNSIHSCFMCFAEEGLSKYLGTSFIFEHETLLITFKNIRIRFKKLGSTERIGKGKPSNIKTHRNSLFESGGQPSLFSNAELDEIYGYNNPSKQVTITLGYYHNSSWKSVDAIEFLFEESKAHVLLNEPKASEIIKLSDKKTHPENNVRRTAKKKIKEERLKNAKRKENAQN